MIVIKKHDIDDLMASDVCIEFNGARLNNVGWEYKLSKVLSSKRSDFRYIILKTNENTVDIQKVKDRINLKITLYDSSIETSPEKDSREVLEIIRDVNGVDHYLLIEDIVHSVLDYYPNWSFSIFL